MKKFLSLSLAVFTAICLVLASDRRAMAYVDPGSGFIALQTAASVMAACGYFLRRQIGTFFGKKEAVVLPPASKESPRSAA